jgi:hypothetical protein
VHNDYSDIRALTKEEPKWFDEHAVPRYCDFHPKEIADIYADECCLLMIQCQGCQARFKVAISQNKWSMAWGGHEKLDISERIAKEYIGFGDPPNVGCCPAGPTMTSDTIAVLEYWKRESCREWERDKNFEKVFGA